MRPFTTIAAVIFGLMAVAHIYRLAVGFPVVIGGHELGQGASILALLITGTLSAMLIREAKR